MNIRGWDELSYGGAKLDRAFKLAAFAILYDVLGPARVRGVKDLDMFWISSIDKKAPPSRVLDLRYVAAKRKITCRLMLAPTGVKGFARRYPADMERLTLEVLAGIETRLAKSGTVVDLARTRAAITRRYAALARKQLTPA
jgi:hypothetical protein